MNDRVKATYLLMIGNIYTISGSMEYDKIEVLGNSEAKWLPTLANYEISVGVFRFPVSAKEYYKMKDCNAKFVKEKFFGSLFKEIKIMD